MGKGGGHHIKMPPLLQGLTILNVNTMMLPSLGTFGLGLQCNAVQPKFRDTFCIVHISMLELSGFADAYPTDNTCCLSLSACFFDPVYTNRCVDLQVLILS